MQSTVIKREDLAKVEDIIFRFIWNIKKDNPIASGRIKREIIKSNHSMGGLRAPDIYNIDKAIKYKNMLRNIFNSEHKHPIQMICKNELQNYGFEWNSYTATCSRSELAGSYFGIGVGVHLDLGLKLHNDIKLVS